MDQSNAETHPIPAGKIESPAIPKIMTLKTLTDVRTLMRHLPPGHRDRRTWLMSLRRLRLAPIRQAYQSRSAWHYRSKASNAGRRENAALSA
jgi:hypothetical protein